MFYSYHHMMMMKHVASFSFIVSLYGAVMKLIVSHVILYFWLSMTSLYYFK